MLPRKTMILLGLGGTAAALFLVTKKQPTITAAAAKAKKAADAAASNPDAGAQAAAQAAQAAASAHVRPSAKLAHAIASIKKDMAARRAEAVTDIMPPLQPPPGIALPTYREGVVQSPKGETIMQWGAQGRRHLVLVNGSPVRILQVLNNGMLVIAPVGLEQNFASQGTVAASDIQYTS